MAAPLRRLQRHQAGDPRGHGRRVGHLPGLPRVDVPAGGPLFDRARQAGQVRADIDFDDLLRMVAGISATNFLDDAQRDRVLGVALDGVRAAR